MSVITPHAVISRPDLLHSAQRTKPGSMITPNTLHIEENQVIMFGPDRSIFAHSEATSTTEKVDIWGILTDLSEAVMPRNKKGDLSSRVFYFSKGEGWYSRPDYLFGYIGREHSMMALYTWNKAEILLEDYIRSFQPNLISYFERNEGKFITMLMAMVRIDPAILALINARGHVVE